MNDLPILVALVMGFLGVIFSIFNQNHRFADLKESINHRFDEVDRRFEQVDKRFDEILGRLVRIENKMDNHEQRITRLEEPLVRR